MSVKTNAGFPRNIFKWVSDRLTAVETKATQNQENISTLTTATSKKTVYSDFMVTQASISLTLTLGETRQGTLTLTQNGYYPLGIVGDHSTQETFDIKRNELTSRTNGNTTISYTVHNEDYGNPRTGTIAFNVLWVKIR